MTGRIRTTDTDRSPSRAAAEGRSRFAESAKTRSRSSRRSARHREGRPAVDRVREDGRPARRTAERQGEGLQRRRGRELAEARRRDGATFGLPAGFAARRRGRVRGAGSRRQGRKGGLLPADGQEGGAWKVDWLRPDLRSSMPPAGAGDGRDAEYQRVRGPRSRRAALRPGRHDQGRARAGTRGRTDADLPGEARRPPSVRTATRASTTTAASSSSKPTKIGGGAESLLDHSAIPRPPIIASKWRRPAARRRHT